MFGLTDTSLKEIVETHIANLARDDRARYQNLFDVVETSSDDECLDGSHIEIEQVIHRVREACHTALSSTSDTVIDLAEGLSFPQTSGGCGTQRAQLEWEMRSPAPVAILKYLRVQLETLGRNPR